MHWEELQIRISYAFVHWTLIILFKSCPTLLVTLSELRITSHDYIRVHGVHGQYFHLIPIQKCPYYYTTSQIS